LITARERSESQPYDIGPTDLKQADITSKKKHGKERKVTIEDGSIKAFHLSKLDSIKGGGTHITIAKNKNRVKRFFRGSGGGSGGHPKEWER